MVGRDYKHIDIGLLTDMAKSGYGETTEQKILFEKLHNRLKQDWQTEKKPEITAETVISGRLV